MTALFHDLIAFFCDNWPTGAAVLTWGPLALIWSLACLSLAGWLKQRHGWRTGYTRKLFHFVTFASAAVIHSAGGTRAVCLFGAATSVVVLHAVWRGQGNRLYEAMAREKDAPHRSRYILLPWLATLLGGLISNAFFGPAALAGYLVAGLGDAAGEPVGTRFGRHTYRVPAVRGVSAARSWEGSAAVFAVSALALACGGFAGSVGGWSLARVGTALVIAAVAAAAEAVSPHGWDNLTMQVIPSWLVARLILNAVP